MKKLRTRRHSVVLNRSRSGDAGITVLLVLLGAFMFLPLWYQIANALKPLGELNASPLLCNEADAQELCRSFH